MKFSRPQQILALLALVGNTGCFLFKTDKPATQPPAAQPAAVQCEPPDVGAVSPEGITLLPLDALESNEVVGEVVYAIEQPRIGARNIEIGQPLRVCSVRSAKSTTTTLDGERYTVEYPVAAKVADAKGELFDMPVFGLSSTPPKLVMANPGTADELIKSVFAHAYELEMLRIDIRKNYVDEGLESAHKVGDTWEVNWDYHVDFGLQEASKEATGIMFAAAYGNISRQTVLSQSKYAWVATAEDDAIVDLFSGGKKEGENGEMYEGMHKCITGLGSVNSSYAAIGHVEAQRREKRWRRGLEGTSESKLAKMDAEEEAKLDAKKQLAQDFIDEHIDPPECVTARKFAGLD